METKIVCFTDINGFHKLSKNKGIDIAEFLNNYYQFVGEINKQKVGHSSLIQNDVFGLAVNHAAISCTKQGVSISPESIDYFT